MSTHRLTTALTGLVATLALTACGSGDSTTAPSADAGSGTPSSSSASSSAAPGEADVTFARSMIVHHQQALEMAELAATRAGSAEVRDLADRIAAAQTPEIDTMAGWLEEWGAEPADSGQDGGHGGHGTGGMPGEMSAGDMDRLGSLSGAEFDREFLTLMVAHHEGAVEMAETEQAEGSDPDALALAERVVTDQTAEIAEMRELLQAG